MMSAFDEQIRTAQNGMMDAVQYWVQGELRLKGITLNQIEIEMRAFKVVYRIDVESNGVKLKHGGSIDKIDICDLNNAVIKESINRLVERFRK